MRLILASQSSFRKYALDMLGLKYETIPSNINESAIRHDDPCKLSIMLSEAKAKKIGKENSDSLIISADLFVVHDNKIIENPVDENHAKQMLKSFSGKSFTEAWVQDIIEGNYNFKTAMPMNKLILFLRENEILV